MTSTETDLRLGALVGHGPSLYALGIACLTGAYGPDKVSEAATWLWLAQDSGEVIAPWVAELLAAKGLTLTPPPDLPEPKTPDISAPPHAAMPSAQELYARAEAAAHAGDAMAMTILGHYAEVGFITDPNLELAFSWYSKAAAHGHMYGLAEYARCLLDGIGTQANTTSALAAFMQAAFMGHEQAGKTAALAMLTGTLPADKTLCFQLIHDAAKTDEEAYATLAYLYATGYGTIEDKPKAQEMIFTLLRNNKGWKLPDGIDVDTRAFCVSMSTYFEKEGDLPHAWLWVRLLPEDPYAQEKMAAIEHAMTSAQKRGMQDLLNSLKTPD